MPHLQAHIFCVISISFVMVIQSWNCNRWIVILLLLKWPKNG